MLKIFSFKLISPFLFLSLLLMNFSVFSEVADNKDNGDESQSISQKENQNKNRNKNIVWMDCWFDIPGDLPKELEVECGQWRTQSLPRQSSAPASIQASDEKPRIQTEFNLMFVVLRDNSTDHQKDPLFYLSGGPGSSTYLEKENIDSWFYWFEIAKLSRDIILVDQRGTGLSRPKFECDNYTSFVREALKDNLSNKEEYIKAYNTVDTCLKKAKKKGFKSSDYSTSLSADDMNHIANALGYSEWNIIGGSYGTRLGLEWMRQNPTQIRSAILDSVYPVDKGALEQWPQTINNAFAYFWSQCASSTQCVNKKGDKEGAQQAELTTDQAINAQASEKMQALENTRENAEQLEKNFWKAVAKLDEHPQTLTIPLWYGDWPMKVVVNGHRFISVVYQSLYDDALQDDILKAIKNINSGSVIIKTKALKKLTESSINSELAAEFNVLTYFAVECSETPIPNQNDFFKELNQYPLFKSYGEDAYEYDPCNLVNKRADLNAFRQPVKSDVPTLILSGGYDPVTPTAWARELSGRLKNSILWYLPELGHGVVNGNACVHQSLRVFLDNPKRFSLPDC